MHALAGRDDNPALELLADDPAALAPIRQARVLPEPLQLMRRCERLSDDRGDQVRLQESQEVVSLHYPDVAEMGSRPVLLLSWYRRI
jgi:hypothetical protein